MGLRRHHYLIEGLREHRRGKKGNRPQRILAGVLQIVTHRRRQDEDAARSDCAGRAVLEIKLAGAGDDVLRFFGSVSVPAEPAAGLDFVDDGGRRRCAVAAEAGEGALPTDRRIALPSNLGAFKFA